MCHFISAVLPASVDIASLSVIAEKHGRRLRPQDNRSIEQALKPGESYFVTTAGHCDCGTALGRHANASAATGATELRKLRLKGWSEAKIARWREQRDAHQAGKGAVARAASEADIARWQSFLADMLAHKHAPYVCLLIHLYDGDLDRDIVLAGRVAVKLRDADAHFLRALSEDVLYEFHA